jgi:hypothetical protein
MNNTLFVKLKAMTTTSITGSTNDVFAFDASTVLNDIYDWRSNAATLKVQGATQYFGFYEKCLVTASKIKVFFRVNSTTATENDIRNCMVCLYPSC